MTFRELESFIEGHSIFMDRMLDISAWMQSNLINIHIPKGKPRVQPDDLRPKKKQPRKKRSKKQELVDVPDLMSSEPKEGDTEEDIKNKQLAALNAEKRRRRIAREMEQDAEFWDSDEGRSVAAMIDPQPENQEEESDE